MLKKLLIALAVVFVAVMVFGSLLERRSPGAAETPTPAPIPTSTPAATTTLLAIEQRRELHVKNAKGVALSIREPATKDQVQSLIDAHNSGYFIVRVFIHGQSATLGKDPALSLYEWTRVDGLKKKY